MKNEGQDKRRVELVSFNSGVSSVNTSSDTEPPWSPSPSPYNCKKFRFSFGRVISRQNDFYGDRDDDSCPTE